MGDWTKGLRTDPITPRTKQPTNVQAGEQLPPNSARGGSKFAHTSELLPPNSARGTPRFRHAVEDMPPNSTNPKGIPKSAVKTSRSNYSRPYSNDPENAECNGDESPRAASVISASDTHAMEEYEFDGDSVQVVVRVRPANMNELEQGAERSCVSVSGTRRMTLRTAATSGNFEFDAVLGENSTQEEVFELVGLPMVEHCLTGYNSSIFAYGQTGAGKTHTMLGEISASNEEQSVQRGLTPRVFDYLFEKIAQEEANKELEVVRYNCSISFLEIYNETITDLLETKATDLQPPTYLVDNVLKLMRKGATNRHVRDDVLKLMRKGAANRHVRETRLNCSSSRSHSVFKCSVERSSEPTRCERLKGGALGGEQAQGEHRKETVNINQSLLTLRRVITLLSENKGTKKGAAPVHGSLSGYAEPRSLRVYALPVLNSPLTFICHRARWVEVPNHDRGVWLAGWKCQTTIVAFDSLGGNAKTTIVACVSPACPDETTSTLKFVQSAKSIVNRATINLDYRGDVRELQKEIQKLNSDLEALRKGFTDPAIQEAKSLRATLAE
eukprot:gene5742-6036_t